MARPRDAVPDDGEEQDRATSSLAARRAVLKRIKDEGVGTFSLVHRPRGSPEVVRDHADGDGGARSNDGMGFDGSSITGFNAIEESDMVAIPDPATLPAHAAAGTSTATIGAKVGTDDLRRRHARRRSRTRATRATSSASALERMQEHGLRRVQRRPRARVLPVRGRQGHGDARRGRLLRDDGAGRRDRGPQRHDPRARVGRDPDRVPPPRGRRRRSTRSTCATPTRSTMADYTVTYRLIVKEVAA